MSERQAWRVTNPAHEVPRTTGGGEARGESYAIPARESIRFEESVEAARRFVVTWAHVDAGVPAWLPYLAQTLRLARAERVTITLGSTIGADDEPRPASF